MHALLFGQMGGRWWVPSTNMEGSTRNGAWEESVRETSPGSRALY